MYFCSVSCVTVFPENFKSFPGLRYFCHSCCKLFFDVCFVVDFASQVFGLFFLLEFLFASKFHRFAVVLVSVHCFAFVFVEFEEVWVLLVAWLGFRN